MEQSEYGDETTFKKVREFFESCPELKVVVLPDKIEVWHEKYTFRCHMVRVHLDYSRLMLDILERACCAVDEMPSDFWLMVIALFPGTKRPYVGSCNLKMMPVRTEAGAMDLSEYHEPVLEHAFETLWGVCTNK